MSGLCMVGWIKQIIEYNQYLKRIIKLLISHRCILTIINFIKMLKQKDSLLLVDYDIIRGLLLKWNLTSNTNPVYFRHIVIFDVSLQFDVKSFVDRYFNKIKSGDMISFSCITEDEDFQMVKWKEKSPLTQVQISRLRPSQSSIKNIARMLEKIDILTQQFTEPIIYNFVTSKKSNDLNKLNTFLKKWMENKQSFISNVFADVQTSIQPSTGINQFNIEEFSSLNPEKNWNFYKLYLNQISLLKIKITLECENGFFASKKEDEWKNIDFNKITRVIYAPSTNYIQDIIQFVNEDSSLEVNYVLNITLEFTELDNHSYSAFKKVTIKAMAEKVYQRTYGGRQIEFASQVFPGFYSLKNPFSSESLVWFKKDIEV